MWRQTTFFLFRVLPDLSFHHHCLNRLCVMGSDEQGRLSQFANETTLHGVSYAINYKKSERLLWVFMLFLAVVLSFALTTNVWMKFFEGELGTKNEPVDDRDVAFMQSQFPLMYCPSNWIDPYKVVKLMEEHNVSMAGIEYALSLIPVDEESLNMLRTQLIVFDTSELEWDGPLDQNIDMWHGFMHFVKAPEVPVASVTLTINNAKTDSGSDIQSQQNQAMQNALTEFAKLPFEDLVSFVDNIALDYELYDTVLDSTSFRYGRRCLQLRANGSNGNDDAKTITFAVGHRSPLISNTKINVLISPVAGKLKFSDEALGNLEKSFGFATERPLIELPPTDVWSSNMLKSVSDQFSVRANVYKYIRNCEKTELSGVGRSELMGIQCEETCRYEAQQNLANSRFNCSMTESWNTWNRSSLENPPCNLDSDWFDQDRSTINVALSSMPNCSCSVLPECVDYSRMMQRYAEQIEEYDETGSNFVAFMLAHDLITKEEQFELIKGEGIIVYADNFGVGFESNNRLHTFGYESYKPVSPAWTGNYNLVNISDRILCDAAKGSIAVFTSPYYPNDYESNTFCFYLFMAPEDHHVKLTTITANMETKDHFTCFERNFVSGSEIGFFTGCTPDQECSPQDQRDQGQRVDYSVSNHVICYFLADYADNNQGFKLLLHAVPNGEPAANQTEDPWRTKLREFYYSDSALFQHTISLKVLEMTQSVEYEVVDWTDLVSNVGGVLALFIGSSILSLVHLCWFCAKSMCSSRSVGK